jgi:hypothetical protein
MLSGDAELSEGRSPEAIEIPLPCSGLCEKMFGYFQRRRRPLTDKSSISKDIVQRAAQNRNRLGVVGLACGHARLLFVDYYDKMTTQTKRPTEGGHARNAGSRRWLTIATGPGLENQSNRHGFLELDEVVIG